MYTLDCGKNTATLYNGEVVKKISHKEVLRLADHLEAGSTLVGEYAHFGCPRKELSLCSVPPTRETPLKVNISATNIRPILPAQPTTPIFINRALYSFKSSQRSLTLSKKP